MQWKRGFLLAGIHLAVVVAMFVQEESAVWPMIKANTDRTSCAWLPGRKMELSPSILATEALWMVLCPRRRKLLDLQICQSLC